MRIARSIVVAAFAAAALPVAAQEITLKVHHFWPPGAMPPSQLLVPWCDKIAKDSANRLKCQVYPAMQLPGLSDALSKGVVDGYLLPWEVIPSIKAHELTKFHSETDPKSRALYTAVFTLQMNQAKYESLPADLKKVIDANSGAALSKAFGQKWDASAPPARKLATDRNNTFYVIPASELANWEKATANLDDEWVRDMTAKGHDGKALLQSAKDMIKKYEAVK